MSAEADPHQTVVDQYTRLLSLAVHEFRTPASVVGGYLRMLLGDAGGPLTPHQRKMIDEADKSCERIVALVGELDAIARLDAGTVTLQRESFDVFEIAREASRGVRDAENREVRVDRLGDTAGAPCIGDRARLSAALAAVVRAIAREQTSGAIAIDCRVGVDEGRRLATIVVVAGGGDAHGARSAPRTVFDERQGGLGLALPLARRVIERHGGRVWSPAATPDAKPPAAAVVAIPIT